MFACSKSIIRRKFEIRSQLRIQKLDRSHWHHSSVFILNLEQSSHVTFVIQLLTLNRQFLVETDDSTKKPLKIKSFLLFNFAVTKIYVVIRLAKDGTRMDEIQFQLSPNVIRSQLFETQIFINYYSKSFFYFLMLQTTTSSNDTFVGFYLK